MTEPYRDESNAIEEKLRRIDEELAQIEASSARRPALQKEANELARRLKEARRSPLDEVRIATPCSARWEEMTGDDRVRHCAACDKDVFNIAGMPRAEAVALLSKGTSVCIRMFKRTDGTVLTSDCPVGVRKKRVRRLAILGAGISAALGGGLMYAWVEPASVFDALSGRTGTMDTGEAEPYAVGSIPVPVAAPPAMTEQPGAATNRPVMTSEPRRAR